MYVFLIITNAPFYLRNQTLHEHLRVSYTKDIIKDRSIKRHEELTCQYKYVTDAIATKY